MIPDLSLAIESGSITGLVGPSGCGKTTLMRSIVGVQVVASGEVTVLGRPAGSPELRRRIGYSTQSAAVYSDLTVAQTLRYFAAVLGVGAEDVERVMDLVDLTANRSQRASDLSGGQLSRSSLAVALLGHPELLVLDEPTVGLDPLLRDDLWSLFHRLRDEQRTTILISTHVMDEASRCDQLLLMRDGTILAHDSPYSLAKRTGTDNLEQAFLKLVREQAVERAQATGDEVGARP